MSMAHRIPGNKEVLFSIIINVYRIAEQSKKSTPKQDLKSRQNHVELDSLEFTVLCYVLIICSVLELLDNKSKEKTEYMFCHYFGFRP